MEVTKLIHAIKGMLYEYEPKKDDWTKDFLNEIMTTIEKQQKEIESLKRNLSLLCPIGDLSVIESLKAEKLMYMEQITEYKRVLNIIIKKSNYYNDKGWALNPDKIIEIIEQLDDDLK